MSDGLVPDPRASTQAFPPALIPRLRARLSAQDAAWDTLGDHVFDELLATVFFAGLQTHEGEHYPVRVAFGGPAAKTRLPDVLPSDDNGAENHPTPLYRWSGVRFDPVRSFCVSELVKLSAATRQASVFTKVDLKGDSLFVGGLTREGLNRAGDPYLKVISLSPGQLSLRQGREALAEYDSGRICTETPDIVLSQGLVRTALEAAAARGGVSAAATCDYLNIVRAIVREMAAHGRGGIVVISAEPAPDLEARAAYRTPTDSTFSQLLHYLDGSAGARRSAVEGPPSTRGAPVLELRRMLRSAFARETQRWAAEVGGFTAVDGATVLGCSLGLCGFGVVLPVEQTVEVVEAASAHGAAGKRYELSTRGTRHRAAATYASGCPGSVVFVASHDGPICCMLAEPGTKRVLAWLLAASDFL